jgi:uncharacterized membrane protein YeaQ/YmgE (transglycosylase-associated protein family)
MGILSWIVVGLIAGWLAEQFFRGARFGLVGAILLGIVGALLGGFLASTVLKIPDPVSGFNLTTILTAFAGSVILLILIRVFNEGEK